jgi:hypothetical protein
MEGIVVRPGALDVHKETVTACVRVWERRQLVEHMDSSSRATPLATNCRTLSVHRPRPASASRAAPIRDGCTSANRSGSASSDRCPPSWQLV